MKFFAMAAALLIASVSIAPAALSYNPPGRAGGPGHGKYWHRNPAGPAGGAGCAWTYNPPGPGKTMYYGGKIGLGNPPGAAGGPGHGRYWRYNPAGPKGGPGRGWTHNPPGPGRVVYDR